MIKINNPAGCLLAAFAILLIALLLAVMPGCESQKHINKSEVSTDSIALSEKDKIIRMQQTEIEHYQQRISEMENLGVTFVQSDCPEVNIDSLKAALLKSGCKQSTVDSAIAAYNTINEKYEKAQTTIQKLADGSLIIKGNISELKQSNQKLTETIRAREKDIKFITEEYNRLSVELQKSQSEKVKEVKRSILSGWWLWIIFLVVGFALGFYVCLKLGKFAEETNDGVFG